MTGRGHTQGKKKQRNGKAPNSSQALGVRKHECRFGKEKRQSREDKTAGRHAPGNDSSWSWGSFLTSPGPGLHGRSPPLHLADLPAHFIPLSVGLRFAQGPTTARFAFPSARKGGRGGGGSRGGCPRGDRREGRC